MMGGGTSTAPPPVESPSPPMSILPPNRLTGTQENVIEVLDSTTRSANGGAMVVAKDELDFNYASYSVRLSPSFSPRIQPTVYERRLVRVGMNFFRSLSVLTQALA